MRVPGFAAVALLTIAGVASAGPPASVDWPRVGNDPGGMRFSPLDQVHRGNVARLEPAWTYHTGEPLGREGKTIECTPIVVDGVMYVTTGRASRRRPRCRGRPCRTLGNSTR